MATKTPRTTIEKKKSASTKKTAIRPAVKSTARKKPRREETPIPVVETAPVARRRPLFQAGTWISILMLAALVGLAFYLNREKETKTAEATPTLETAFIFTGADGVVSSIEVKPAVGETVKIGRNAENVWMVILPVEAEANQGLAESAATQLTALSITSPIEGKPGVFGFDNPAYVITTEFKDGKKRTLEVGDNTPSGNGYYVRVDGDRMLITDMNGIDALVQLAAFPPYLNTPAPTALPPTGTPIPTAEAVVTPTP